MNACSCSATVPCGTKQCKCHKEGRRCNEGCGCRGDPGRCGNPATRSTLGLSLPFTMSLFADTERREQEALEREREEGERRMQEAVERERLDGERRMREAVERARLDAEEDARRRGLDMQRRTNQNIDRMRQDLNQAAAVLNHLAAAAPPVGPSTPLVMGSLSSPAQQRQLALRVQQPPQHALVPASAALATASSSVTTTSPQQGRITHSFTTTKTFSGIGGARGAVAYFQNLQFYEDVSQRQTVNGGITKVVLYFNYPGTSERIVELVLQTNPDYTILVTVNSLSQEHFREIMAHLNNLQ